MRSQILTLVLAALLGPLAAACGPAAVETSPDSAGNPNDAGVATPVNDVEPDEGADVSDLDPAGLPPLPDAVAEAFLAGDDPFLSTDEVQAAMDAGMDIQFIDARPPLDYEFGHIPGAINVEYSTADQYDVSTLPTDRWMVAYCECPHAEAQQVYDAFRAKGIANIKVLDEGLAGWRDTLGRQLEQSPASSEG